MKAVIQDKLGRPIRDLRISVTDRCNFRCDYCMPKEIFGDDYTFLPKDELLTFEELTRISKIYAQLGVKKIRITGGEPLLRRNLYKLIEQLNLIDGIEDIGLTTNGLLLKKHGKNLYQAGLRRINVSLDAIEDNVFQEINNRNIKASTILEQIDYAVSIGFEVKVNVVIQKGVNDNQTIPMIDYFKNKNIEVRFIESERELSQLKHWLKTTYRISIEEFVVLYKVYADTKISGKELRDTLHFEMLWDTSKIDVIIRKIYKKELISKLRSETDERQVYYFFDAKQKKLLDKMTGEIETISIAN